MFLSRAYNQFSSKNKKQVLFIFISILFFSQFFITQKVNGYACGESNPNVCPTSVFNYSKIFSCPVGCVPNGELFASCGFTQSYSCSCGCDTNYIVGSHRHCTKCGTPQACDDNGPGGICDSFASQPDVICAASCISGATVLAECGKTGGCNSVFCKCYNITEGYCTGLEPSCSGGGGGGCKVQYETCPGGGQRIVVLGWFAGTDLVLTV